MDPPLTQQGFGMAEALRYKVPDVQVYASDLMRAMQTAACLSKRVTSTEALRPWNVGLYAGQPGRIVHPKLVQFQRNGLKVPFGERWGEFVNRLLTFVHSVKDDAIFVTHFRCCKVLLAWQAAGCGTTLDETTLFEDNVRVAEVLTIHAELRATS